MELVRAQGACYGLSGLFLLSVSGSQDNRYLPDVGIGHGCFTIGS